MRITDLAIIFTAVFFPFFLLIGMHAENMTDTAYIEMKYSAGLKAAVQDGGEMLNVNETQSEEAGYESIKRFRADREKALSTFSNTLYINMGIQDDPQAQAALWWYIPALVVVDYDGYYIYSMQSYTGPDGEEQYRHVWTPKIPYAYSDGEGSSIHFTLDNQVEVYDGQNEVWYSGLQKELAGKTGVSLVDRPERFEEIRRITIVHSIQEELAYYIKRHNTLALRNGVSYRFSLPVISQEEWTNTINDIGLMAFIQGIPIGDRYYNNYSLGGGRLVKAPVYYGGVEPDTGMKYVYRSACSFPYEVREVFGSRKEAAASGYREKSCL
ncbi:hypothetical protein [Paenibacillus dakarensis]|uniref:hypothetical protein n=1 Tax=Paenibacillus dakarensis TaxID=1527293 RepID=UPI0006D568C3|nr:hypothetical protein [Paenibacillus dakarensis]